MRSLWIGTALFLVATIALAMLSRLTAAELKPGDPAPDFSMPGSDGKTYRLADFKGRQAVVLAWFPKAFTPGCTAECKSFRADGDALRKFDVAYFTASTDTAEQNRKFAESLGLDYPILSDSEGDVARAYGVTDAVQKFPRRWTFYIGADGRILHIDKGVRTSTHATYVAGKLKELGVKTRG